MIDEPAYIAKIEDALVERGRERRENGEIGWSVDKDHLLQIYDDQADTIGAITHDNIYRTSSDEFTVDYIGAAFCLSLNGFAGSTEDAPIQVTETDADYSIRFELFESMPRVEVDTNLKYWDPDGIYADIEDILDEHDIPVVYAESSAEYDSV